MVLAHHIVRRTVQQLYCSFTAVEILKNAPRDGEKYLDATVCALSLVHLHGDCVRQ